MVIRQFYRLTAKSLHFFLYRFHTIKKFSEFQNEINCKMLFIIFLAEMVNHKEKFESLKPFIR